MYSIRHFDQDQPGLDVGLRFLPICLTATAVCRGALTHPRPLQEVVVGSAVVTTPPPNIASYFPRSSLYEWGRGVEVNLRV